MVTILWLEELIDELESNANLESAHWSHMYLKEQFSFFGVKTDLRRKIEKEYFKREAKSGGIDWKFVFSCWYSDIREMQYVAIDYLVYCEKALVKEDLTQIGLLITSKSWWDTVDGINKVITLLAKRDKSISEVLSKWSEDENMWLRRSALIYQNTLGDKTDVALLEKVIKTNFGSKEFFINKAIGWALRVYARTDEVWVKSFVEKNKKKMSTLSIKEALKRINKES